MSSFRKIYYQISYLTGGFLSDTVIFPEQAIAYFSNFTHFDGDYFQDSHVDVEKKRYIRIFQKRKNGTHHLVMTMSIVNDNGIVKGSPVYTFFVQLL